MRLRNKELVGGQTGSGDMNALGLAVGQRIKIGRVSYKVCGYIDYEEGAWKWTEYWLADKSAGHGTRWLSVDYGPDHSLEYILYESEFRRISPEQSITYRNQRFSLVESGVETVARAVGNVDAAVGEQARYYEYINENGSKRCSVEIWNDGGEISLGRVIAESEVTVEEGDYTGEDAVSGTSEKRTPGKSAAVLVKYGVYALVFAALLGLLFVPGIINAWSAANKSLIKILKDDAYFAYVTSVTNNTTLKKSQVYSSGTSIDATVRYIISQAPESITTVQLGEENDAAQGVGIKTKKEYAFVYLGEEGETLIQATKNKDMSEETTLYHSHNHYVFHRIYWRIFRDQDLTASDHYSAALTSARQSSVNSRASSGGGTSWGK